MKEQLFLVQWILSVSLQEDEWKNYLCCFCCLGKDSTQSKHCSKIRKSKEAAYKFRNQAVVDFSAIWSFWSLGKKFDIDMESFLSYTNYWEFHHRLHILEYSVFLRSVFYTKNSGLTIHRYLWRGSKSCIFSVLYSGKFFWRW